MNEMTFSVRVTFCACGREIDGVSGMDYEVLL